MNKFDWFLQILFDRKRIRMWIISLEPKCNRFSTFLQWNRPCRNIFHRQIRSEEVVNQFCFVATCLQMGRRWFLKCIPIHSVWLEQKQQKHTNAECYLARELMFPLANIAISIHMHCTVHFVDRKKMQRGHKQRKYQQRTLSCRYL